MYITYADVRWTELWPMTVTFIRFLCSNNHVDVEDTVCSLQTMHEVVTLQFGQQANFVSTHYWNTQVRNPHRSLR